MFKQSPRRDQGSHTEDHSRQREGQLRREGSAIGKMPFAMAVDETEELKICTRKFFLTSQSSRITKISYLNCIFAQVVDIDSVRWIVSHHVALAWNSLCRLGWP